MSISSESRDLVLYLLATLAVVAAVSLLWRQAREEARAAREEARAAREETREALRGFAEELRHDIPPAQRARIEGSILAVVRGKAEAGVAFFVSPRTALTAAHNLESVGGTTTRHVK